VNLPANPTWPSCDTIRETPTTVPLATRPSLPPTHPSLADVDRPMGEDASLEDVDPGDLW
jgi:hypothetical protein